MSDQIKKAQLIYEYLKDQNKEITDSFRSVDARVQNHLALIAALLVLTIPVFQEMDTIFQFCKNEIVLVLICVGLISILVMIFACIMNLLKTLSIKQSVPPVNPDGFEYELAGSESDYAVTLNSFILNYIETYKENDLIRVERNHLGRIVKRLIRYTVIAVFAFLLFFWGVRIFYCEKQQQITEVKITEGVKVMTEGNDNTRSQSNQGNDSGGGGNTGGGNKSRGASEPAKIKTSPNLTGKPKTVQFGEGKQQDKTIIKRGDKK